MKLDQTTEFAVAALHDGAGISIDTVTDRTRNSLTIFVTLGQLKDLRALIDAELKRAEEGAPWGFPYTPRSIEPETVE